VRGAGFFGRRTHGLLAHARATRATTPATGSIPIDPPRPNQVHTPRFVWSLTIPNRKILPNKKKSTRRINQLTGRAPALESLPAGFLRNATYCCRLVQAALDPAGAQKKEDFDVQKKEDFDV
jgi:hypothetical protein